MITTKEIDLFFLVRVKVCGGKELEHIWVSFVAFTNYIGTFSKLFIV